MTRKQAFKMINRIHNQLDALDYYISVSRVSEVREILSLKFDVTDRRRIKRAIESLRNDLILTIVACKKDTL